MTEKEIKLVPKKEKSKFNKLFDSKKKRYPMTLLLMLPFIIGIIVFSIVVYREVKNVMSITASGPSETKPSNTITFADNNSYILRDNATDLQKDYFAQLKEAIESGESTGEEIASLIAKNYVADFYTWTNKQGQFDVGGMYYIYDGEFADGDHFRENVYQAARYGYYKYVSYYGSKYGVENLLEVDNVDVTKCVKESEPYVINEHIANRKDENGEWYDYREDIPYNAYNITCKWTYKEGSSLNVNQFANTINLLVIEKDGRYLIVEASEGNVNEKVEENISETEDQEEQQSETSENE